MVEKSQNRAHAAALSLLPTLQLKNFDFSLNFSDALSDAVRGKPLGKHQGSRREAREKRGKHGKTRPFRAGNGGKQPRELYPFIILKGEREA